MNGTLNECTKACLRGGLDDIKKAKWGNGRMGSDNVKVWMKKWTVKYLAWLYRRLEFINVLIFRG